MSRSSECSGDTQPVGTFSFRKELTREGLGIFGSEHGPRVSRVLVLVLELLLLLSNPLNLPVLQLHPQGNETPWSAGAQN